MKKQFIILIAFCLMLLVIPAQAQEEVTPQDLADPDGHFIEIDNAQIYYVERGSSDDPAIMLLHGFGGSTFTWRDNMDPLVDAGYRVIAFDRPPYGLSDKNPDLDFTPQGYALLTSALMDALNIETAVLVGHSAGGAVIAQFAIDYPERVDGLVFVAGALGGRADAATSTEDTPEPDGQSNNSALSGLFSAAAGLDPHSPLAQAAVRTFVTPERFVEILTSAYYDPAIVTDEVALGYQRILQVSGWEVGFLAILSAPDEPIDLDLLAATIDENAILVLLIWGQDDSWVPMTAGQLLRDLLPNSQWITYPQIGHLPMEENIEQFNRDLLAFLASF